MHIIRTLMLDPSRVIFSPDFSGLINACEEDDVLLQTRKILKDDVNALLEFAKTNENILFEPEYTGSPLKIGDLVVVSNKEYNLMVSVIPTRLAHHIFY